MRVRLVETGGLEDEHGQLSLAGIVTLLVVLDMEEFTATQQTFCNIVVGKYRIQCIDGVDYFDF